MLTLTERELGPQWSWLWREGENSGLSVRLQYRVAWARPAGSAQIGEDETFSNYGNFGPIAWLDRDKLAALGFDVAKSTPFADGSTRYDRMLERDVLLVLELDGSVHAHAVQAARDLLAHRELDLAADPANEASAQRLKNAQRALQIEEHEASRLFIVDAGIDRNTLRQRYADRTQYAIVHGTIRPLMMRDGRSNQLYGSVTSVHCETINVPLRFRAAVPIDPPTNVMAMGLARTDEKRPFSIQLAFGSHLEPWIVSAHSGPN